MEDNWKEVVAEWQGGMGFVGRNPAGGEVQIGNINGKPGIGPMEMLLLGLAGCTGMDIVSILEKKRQDLREMQIRVRGKRAETHPKVYTDIEVTYLLYGEAIDPRAVEQAIELSEHKYCSAGAMLGVVAKIKSFYIIYEIGKTLETNPEEN